MRTLSLVATVAILAGCATKKAPAPSPQYAGVTRKAEDVATTVGTAKDSSKEVQSLHRQSMSLLDRIDYKTSILLQ